MKPSPRPASAIEVSPSSSHQQHHVIVGPSPPNDRLVVGHGEADRAQQRRQERVEGEAVAPAAVGQHARRARSPRPEPPAPPVARQCPRRARFPRRRGAAHAGLPGPAAGERSSPIRASSASSTRPRVTTAASLHRTLALRPSIGPLAVYLQTGQVRMTRKAPVMDHRATQGTVRPAAHHHRAWRPGARSHAGVSRAARPRRRLRLAAVPP